MIVLPVFDTVALRLGPLEIHWYGLMYVVGFCLAWVLGRVRCKKPWINMPGQEMDDLLTALIFGLVVGARLGYVIFYDPMYFLRHPVDIVAVWKGGMSFHGGMIGMALAAVWHGRRGCIASPRPIRKGFAWSRDCGIPDNTPHVRTEYRQPIDAAHCSVCAMHRRGRPPGMGHSGFTPPVPVEPVADAWQSLCAGRRQPHIAPRMGLGPVDGPA